MPKKSLPEALSSLEENLSKVVEAATKAEAFRDWAKKDGPKNYKAYVDAVGKENAIAQPYWYKYMKDAGVKTDTAAAKNTVTYIHGKAEAPTAAKAKALAKKLDAEAEEIEITDLENKVFKAAQRVNAFSKSPFSLGDVMVAPEQAQKAIDSLIKKDLIVKLVSKGKEPLYQLSVQGHEFLDSKKKKEEPKKEEPKARAKGNVTAEDAENVKKILHTVPTYGIKWDYDDIVVAHWGVNDTHIDLHGDTPDRGPRTDHGGGSNGDDWMDSDQIARVSAPYRAKWQPKVDELVKLFKSKGYGNTVGSVEYDEKGYVYVWINIK